KPELPLGVSQRVLCDLALGDVADRVGEPRGLSIGTRKRLERARSPEPPAFLPATPPFGLSKSETTREFEPPRRCARGDLLRHVEQAEVAPQHFLGGVPQHAGRSPAP